MDPRDQTFMTIHNLTPDANILFASDSILDVLGYQPDEVKGKSAFEYFHPDEVPFARSVHSRGILLDKAAVLHYARILAKSGQWVSCECCFTVVHNVLVASTSIYFKGEKSDRRARKAPQIRRIFSSSPRDPRYHMLEHLSPKFRMPPMEREPRAALILNRFTRNLTIMYATDAVNQILGLRPDELLERPFYECIQPNCIDDAERCLETAKANESIAYLRFWYKDPRLDANDSANGDDGRNNSEEDEVAQEEEDDEEEEVVEEGKEEGVKPDEMDDEVDERNGSNRVKARIRGTDLGDNSMDVDEEAASSSAPSPTDDGESTDQDGMPPGGACPSGSRGRRPRDPQTFELEAVVSCTSDGLVVVLRRARPPIPDPQPPVIPAAFNYENGLFAAPWGLQPIEPYISPDLLYTFRPPFLPQYMPLRECVKAAGGPPLDQLMRSIRDVAVFAWAVTGINGTLASYGHGRPRIGAQPADGLPVWEPESRANAYDDRAVTGRSGAREMFEEPCGAAPAFARGDGLNPTDPPTHVFRTRHASLDEGMYDSGASSGGRLATAWAPATSPVAPSYPYGGGYEPGGGYPRRPPLRPAFSYDALQDYARHQQQAYAPAVSAREAAARRYNLGDEPWADVATAAGSSTRTCGPSYGPHTAPRGPGPGESSKAGGSGYFWR